MSDNDHVNTNLACPKCGLKPLVTESENSEPPNKVSDYVGRKCVGCGHIFDVDELQEVMAKGLGDFLRDRYKGPKT
jgi:DNA-directed RNA polymerase subunit RPC12/RpoP